MDNANSPTAQEKTPRTPLGMSSFGKNEREQFGQNIRLAMGCIEGTPERTNKPAIPSDKASIRNRLKALSQEITSNHADLLELLVRFDDLQGWKYGGASHCAAWMNVEIGIGMQLSWEYLRVGRKLLVLPTLKTLFRAGKLSWSKVRLISRVANMENEKMLCHAALDASVSDVKRFCEEYRWNESDNDIIAENDRALKQWESRSLIWDEASNGSTRIQLVLPPELAQAFLNSVEHSLGQLDATNSNMSQSRADAAVLMAESSLQSAGRDVATADRYQVVVSVDAADLSSTQDKHYSQCSRNNTKSNLPKKRPIIANAGPIAKETAKRIACDCSFTINTTVNGEPVDIGRKSRIWPNSMERAIKVRDQHCIWPGCTQSRHLHIHHIEHWADGGTTSVDNGACLCSHHHTLVHEGGFSVQRIVDDNQKLNEKFVQQQRTNDLSMFDFEIELRNDKISFDKVCKLSPSRYRFRIVDAHGKDILDHSNTGSTDTKNRSASQPEEYTRVDSEKYSQSECREPKLRYYGKRLHKPTDQTQSFADEPRKTYEATPNLHVFNLYEKLSARKAEYR